MSMHNNFSKKKQINQAGNFNNTNSSYSYSSTKKKELDNAEEWWKSLCYYRTHLDCFLELLGIALFDFQKPIARAIGNFDDSVIVESRSMGKSYLLGACVIGLACLYPGMKIGVGSKTIAQANLILSYIREFTENCPYVKQEIIFPMKISKEGSLIKFTSGAYVESFGIFGTADNIRGKRFGIIILDEARLINSKVINEIITPMARWNRPHFFRMKRLGYSDFKDVNSKVIRISSAYLKSCTFYDKFKDNLEQMGKGDKSHFALAIDYSAGIRNGYITKEYIEEQKRTLPTSSFACEWGSIFVGVDDSSYFKFDEVEKCRILPNVELREPKGSKSRYILTVDPADTTETYGDNTCFCIIKLKEKADGTFKKEIVYLRTFKGISLSEICENIRKLWLRFPSIEKIIVDINGLGRSAPDFLDSSFTMDDHEYPAFIDPDDKRKQNIPNALPILKEFIANNQLNNEMADYMKVCFQNGDINFPVSLAEYREQILVGDEDNKSDKTKKKVKKDKNELLKEEAIIFESEAAMYEILNIRKRENDNGNQIIERIQPSQRKDRYTCIAQGLLYIKQLEDENKAKRYKPANHSWGFATSF